MMKKEGTCSKWINWMNLTLEALQAAERDFAAEGGEVVGAFGVHSVEMNQAENDEEVAYEQEPLVRVEVPLPLRRNDGQIIAAAELGDVYFKLTKECKGLTVWPSLGLCMASNRVEIDEHVWLSVVMPARFLGSLQEYLAKVGLRFAQREVFCLVSSVTRLTISAALEANAVAAAE